MPDPDNPITADPARPISAQAKRLHERLIRLGDTGLLEVQITSGGLGKALNELLLCSMADIKAHPTVMDRSGAPAALVIATPSDLVLKKRGRPPLPEGEGKNARVEWRTTAERKAKATRLAKAGGVSLSAWLDAHVDKTRV